jgi:hypothetical protein
MCAVEMADIGRGCSDSDGGRGDGVLMANLFLSSYPVNVFFNFITY